MLCNYICSHKMRNRYNILFTVLLLFSFSAANSQLSFEIRVSTRTIFSNQEVQAEYVVKNATRLESFTGPQFNGWKIISGPVYSSQQSNINGQISNEVSYVYVLVPARAGRLILPGTTVVAAGKTLSCKPVSIMVKSGKAPNASPPQSSLPSLFDDVFSGNSFNIPELRGGQTPASFIKNHVFIRCETTTGHCYAGEPVQVTYHLYADINCQLKVEKQPAFSGCSILEMPYDEYPDNVTIKGRNYKAYIVRKVQVIPLQPGNVELPPASVDCTFDLLGTDQLKHSYKTLLKSDSKMLTVVPLPHDTSGKFAGAIGNFTITAHVQHPQSPAGETNSLTINIDGQGNLQNATYSGIDWPAGVEHYDAKENLETDKALFPAGMNKSWDIPFIIKQPGEVVIPPVKLTYFNTVHNRYETVSSDVIKIQVTPPLEKGRNYYNPDINLDNKKYLWIIPALALTVGFILILTNKKKKKIIVQKEVMPEPVVTPVKDEPHFSKIFLHAQSIKDDKVFLKRTRAILEELLQYYGKGSTENGLMQLQQKDPPLHSQMKSMIHHLDTILFSPFAIFYDRDELSEQVNELIVKVKSLME
ncbi:MAG: hypothetical protein JWN76_770 [Chitinophagaceae bacterium]|nr:hypothetical protein [Chitinophagaceae bacterium]